MDIKEIKQHLRIATVLRHYGLEPGKHDMLACPFHDDSTPSMKTMLISRINSWPRKTLPGGFGLRRLIGGEWRVVIGLQFTVALLTNSTRT